MPKHAAADRDAFSLISALDLFEALMLLPDDEIRRRTSIRGMAMKSAYWRQLDSTFGVNTRGRRMTFQEATTMRRRLRATSLACCGFDLREFHEVGRAIGRRWASLLYERTRDNDSARDVRVRSYRVTGSVA